MTPPGEYLSYPVRSGRKTAEECEKVAYLPGHRNTYVIRIHMLYRKINGTLSPQIETTHPEEMAQDRVLVHKGQLDVSNMLWNLSISFQEPCGGKPTYTIRKIVLRRGRNMARNPYLTERQKEDVFSSTLCLCE